MTSSIYTNTGIVESSWNSRGLITHNFVNKTLIKQDNGVLWAAVREGHVRKYVNIYKSTDNGFSWKRMWNGTFRQTTRRTGITGLNINGPVMHLTLQEDLKTLYLFHSYYDTAEEMYQVELMAFSVEADSITELDYNTAPYTTWLVDYFDNDMDSLAFDISYTDDIMYMTYASYSRLNVRPYRHTYFSTPDGGTIQSSEEDFYDIISTHADDNSTLHIAALRDLDPNIGIAYLKVDRLNTSMSESVIVHETNLTDIIDLNITKDNNGTILIYWSQKTTDDLFANPYYSISTDNGGTWSEATMIPTTDSQSTFIDVATNQRTARTVAIGCNQGFLLSYVRLFNGKAITYVRTLDYDLDNEEYILSSESIAASHPTKPVVGLRFFRPVGNGKSDLNTKEEIRFAYQVGNGDSTIQVDKASVYFGQKLLKDEAFPILNIVSYEEDEAMENQLLFSFNLLGSTSDNVDYYAEGLVGPLTRKYEVAFNRFGTSVNIDKYEPIQESVLSDKSSYSLEEVWYVKVFFQDINYGFPAPSANESFESYIERDMRKVHLPPDFHLSRQFIINDGNKLKRTVWILTFGGNEYEVSQVVPKFVDNQIVYYTANAYVVGPSRNPFSRTILPSET